MAEEVTAAHGSTQQPVFPDRKLTQTGKAYFKRQQVIRLGEWMTMMMVVTRPGNYCNKKKIQQKRVKAFHCD